MSALLELGSSAFFAYPTVMKCMKNEEKIKLLFRYWWIVSKGNIFPA